MLWVKNKLYSLHLQIILASDGYITAKITSEIPTFFVGNHSFVFFFFLQE